MKSFRNYIKEQKQAEGETTLSPDFLEKKQRRDRQTETRIEKPTQEVNKKAEKHTQEEE